LIGDGDLLQSPQRMPWCQMQRPPSTSMHTPVIMLASSLHR
jgi:hypothetical protein